jgi:8-oxo-dGTP pyrophosphatase MutT (NUDIX family)
MCPDRTTWDGVPIAVERPYGVTAIVYRRSHAGLQLLMLHRAQYGADFDGDWAWTPPAGARQPGEPVEACAQRELREETGLDLHLQPTRCGDDDWYVYVVEAPADTVIVLDAEHDRCEWVPPATAIERCSPSAAREPLEAVSHLLSHAF